MANTHLFKRILLLATVIFSSNLAQAQFLLGNVFLKGQYVEVGIANNGSFGSSVSPPVDSFYHPRPNGGGGIGVYNPYTATYNSSVLALGFVADVDADGWTTGPAGGYIGDYFMPGYPQEGWTISVGASESQAYFPSLQSTGATGYTGTLTGAAYSYSNDGVTATGEWRGNSGSLGIRAVTTVPVNKRYFTTKVTIKNNSAATINNIYYTRTVDPDNDAATVGTGFTTTNVITYQLPNVDNNSLVSATSTSSGTGSPYLGLGSKDCRARVFIVASGLSPTDNGQSLYNEPGEGSPPTNTTSYTQGTTSVSDQGIGIVFKISYLDPGDSTTIAYAYILNVVDLDEAMATTLPSPVVVTPSTHLYGTADTGIIVRGCLPGILSFELPSPMDTDYTIHIIDTGSAVSGIDYPPIPDSIVFLAGDTVASIPFSGIPTFPPVGPKTVTISVISGVACSASTLLTNGITITILDSLPVNILNPDDTICSSESIYIDLMDIIGDTNMTYFWTPTTGVSDPNIKEPVITPPIGTTTYTVHAFYSGYPCDTVTDQITIGVVPSLLTVSAGPDFNVCANVPVTLGGSITGPTGSSASFIGWSPNSYLSDTTILNPIALPFVTTTYYLDVTDNVGCTYKDTATVNITGVAPSVEVFADHDTVCPNGGTNLGSIVGGQQPCGLALALCGGTPGFEYVGTGTLASTSPTPYAMSDLTSGDRMQILYSRQDLLNSGVRPGYINSIGFNISGKFSDPTDVYQAFQVKMGCTNVNSLKDSNFAAYPGMVVVHPAANAMTVNGWNTYTFPTPYYWDGSSNLIVELCWSTPYGFFGSDRYDEVFATGTSYNSVLWYGGHYSGASGTSCSADNGIGNVASNLRPNTRFNMCVPNAVSYSWTPAANLNNATNPAPTVSNLANTTTYTLTASSLTDPACKNTDAITIVVDNSNAIDALPHSPYVICTPGYVNLDANAIGNAAYSNLSCGTTGTITCTTPDVTIVGQQGGASGYGSPFSGIYNSAKTQFIVDRHDMHSAGMPSSTIQKVSFYVGNVSSAYPYDSFSLSIGCTAQTDYPSSNGFIGGLTQVYTNNALALVPNSWNTFTFTTPYNWDTNQNIVMQMCYSVPFTSFAPDEVWTTGTPAYSTIQGYLFAPGICVNPSGATYNSFALRPTVQFTYCPAPAAPFEYTWSPGTFISDSTIKNPVAYIPGPTTYYVSTVGRNGCVVSDSVYIFIPTHDFAITPVDTNICPGDRILYHVTGSNAATYTWFENDFTTPATNLSCSNCANPVATPTQDVTYNVIINDVVNCPDTVSAHVHVYPTPPVNILNNDTTIKYGTSFMLIVTGANDYSWSPVGSLSDPRLPNPIASPLEPTDYIVIGLDAHGCKNTDMIHVDIDYRDSLMVPTAFTPNGDGRNDVFHVVGITFHKLMEFRVFNRWGQEIYNTTDPQAGWDGSWKGVLQDMGVYNYIIRVAFPDGTMETYKGDVTLIR